MTGSWIHSGGGINPDDIALPINWFTAWTYTNTDFEDWEEDDGYVPVDDGEFDGDEYVSLLLRTGRAHIIKTPIVSEDYPYGVLAKFEGDQDAIIDIWVIDEELNILDDDTAEATVSGNDAEIQILPEDMAEVEGDNLYFIFEHRGNINDDGELYWEEFSRIDDTGDTV